eukprot:m51a1_g130 hypothetical protein (176) ;mRNA; r:437154-437817
MDSSRARVDSLRELLSVLHELRDQTAALVSSQQAEHRLQLEHNENLQRAAESLAHVHRALSQGAAAAPQGPAERTAESVLMDLSDVASYDALQADAVGRVLVVAAEWLGLGERDPERCARGAAFVWETMKKHPNLFRNDRQVAQVALRNLRYAGAAASLLPHESESLRVFLARLA